jgi:gliding motility-associated-like protein
MSLADTHSRLLFITFLACLFMAQRSRAQCSNWKASAQLTAASTCASNGSFNVTLSGPDVANLSNIQYGIPISPNGFSVPLNSSPNFTSVPPGSYQVSVVADCNGSPVGRNTTITVPGTYTPPILQFYKPYSKASLSCKYTGQIYAYTNGGAFPYTFNLTSYPAAYTGPTSFANQPGFYYFSNLPPGVYTIQIVDACMSGTAPKNDTVLSLNPTLAPYVLSTYFAPACDTLIIRAPYMNVGSGPWVPYLHDTSFKVSMRVSGGISSGTPPIPITDSYATIKLPAGKSIKDLYGDTITYTILPPCGPPIIRQDIIPFPGLSTQVIPNCNLNFTLSLGVTLACTPITYNLLNTTTNVSYGPYVGPGNSYSIPQLPFGSYSITFTTADGYTRTSTINVVAPPANPYAVSVVSGAIGLNNFAAGFTFTTNSSAGGGNKTVELFSGPAGYSYQGQWTNTQPYTVSSNQTPTPTTLKFPAGTYVWKVTDACGVYYLTVTVTASDLYQFTVGIPTQQASCQGLWITPTGTSFNNGISKPIGFSLLLNGSPLQTSTPTGVKWLVHPLGTPILLTIPGVYTILPTSSTTAISLARYYNPGNFTLSYPNMYSSSYTFTYTQQPLSVDINNTQGFLCKGAGPGQGQIYAAGKNGIPFYSAPSPHYEYYLAAPGNAVSGPYIANNNTGVFTGFGANANAVYDLKVVDTCGAFAVQQIKILDLGTSRLISSSSYVSCTGGQVQLSAIYLPGATYSWTGPNGFSSTLRQPILFNTTVANTGVYRVTILSTQCNQPVSDSTTLVISGGPPKPTISYSCLPKPVQLFVTNASSGIIYNWEIGRFLASAPAMLYTRLQQPSDSPWTKMVLYTASYKAIALDTVTRCFTLSDSLLFLGDPANQLQATIYSPHLQLCVGDTTVLVAGGHGSALSVAYQWYRNGLAIPGAASISYAAYQPGSYRVFIDAGLCNRDTSAAVTVTVIPYPTAAITPSALRICQGDTAKLQATTGTGYTYTWYRNGTTIPAAFSSLYPATLAGTYHVIVSNGGCIATATPVTIVVVPPPVVTISPSSTQGLCPGDSILFSTPTDTGYVYRWERNGQPISGAVADSYAVKQPGIYRVLVATALCPYTPSPAVNVGMLPTVVYLGPDTTDCDLPSNLQLSLQVDSAFSSIKWSSGATTPQITTTGPGTYWVSASNRCGVFSDTVHVYSISDFMPGLPDDTLICNKAMSGLLQVPAMLKDVQWSTGATGPTLLVTAPGLYWVSGQSPCGILADTVNVSFCKPDIRELALSVDSLCEGDCLDITSEVVDYPAQYEWIFEGGNPGSSSLANPGMVCYPKAGIYTVTLIARNTGGADTATMTVVVSAMPQPRFRDTVLTVPYKSVITIPACASAQHTDWYIRDSLICKDCPELSIDARYYLTQYRCIVRNGDCPDSCSYVLRVVDIPNDLWLPDAFTPNGDNRNDVFHIITDNPNIAVINLDVYNRWGQRIFRSNANNRGWDGTFGGQPVAFGTYFWQLRYKVLGRDDVYAKKGDVLLLR